LIYEWPSLFLVIFSFSREKKRVHRRNRWSNLNRVRKWWYESTRNYKMEDKLSYCMWIYSFDCYSNISRFHRNAFTWKQFAIRNRTTNSAWKVILINRSFLSGKPDSCPDFIYGTWRGHFSNSYDSLCVIGVDKLVTWKIF